MKNLFVITLFSTVTVSGAFNFNIGMDMIVKSYDAVCWFEALKQFPNTRVDMFNECGGSASYTLDYNGRKVFDFNSTNLVKQFADVFDQFPMARIPREYAGNCSQFLWAPLATPPALEGDCLNDGGLEYPYKAFSYCMINQLRRIHGDFAIEAVKNERTHGRVDWFTTFLYRMNEFRILHKSEPFEIVKELSDQAQQWANKMASECKITASTEAERQWNGQATGENLSSVWIGLIDEVSTAAYAAAAAWYEEIKSYPWQTGFKDDDIKKIDWLLFGRIKDFTQLVWQGSRKVGYGYAFNATCADMGLESRFMVSRYFPMGNKLGVKGLFKANVQPPGLLKVVLQAVPKLLGALLG